MNDFALPETRYALSGDVNIAYQVMGEGPVDIILIPGVVSHVDFMHEISEYYRIFTPPIELRPRRCFRQTGPGIIR